MGVIGINTIDDYDWKVRDDARILQQAQEIQQDSARLTKAKGYIKFQVDEGNKTLSKLPKGNVKRSNPATIGYFK